MPDIDIPEIEIPDCELEEVFAVLKLIYTGNFTRPGPTDGKYWVRLWKAAKKFQMKEFAKECWIHIPNELIEEIVSDHGQRSKKKMKECAVCFKKLNKPLHCLIPCGHTDTCLNCIEEIQMASNGSNICSMCRQAFTFCPKNICLSGKLRFKD